MSRAYDPAMSIIATTLRAAAVPLVLVSLVACGGSDSSAGVESAGSADDPTVEATAGGSGSDAEGLRAAGLSDLFSECIDGADFTLSEQGDTTIATETESGHTFTIQRFASEAEAVAYVDQVDVEARAQFGELVAVGDSDDAFAVMAPLTACLHAEQLTSG